MSNNNSDRVVIIESNVLIKKILNHYLRILDRFRLSNISLNQSLNEFYPSIIPLQLVCKRWCRDIVPLLNYQFINVERTETINYIKLLEQGYRVPFNHFNITTDKFFQKKIITLFIRNLYGVDITDSIKTDKQVSLLIKVVPVLFQKQRLFVMLNEDIDGLIQLFDSFNFQTEFGILCKDGDQVVNDIDRLNDKINHYKCTGLSIQHLKSSAPTPANSTLTTPPTIGINSDYLTMLDISHSDEKSLTSAIQQCKNLEKLQVSTEYDIFSIDSLINHPSITNIVAENIRFCLDTFSHYLSKNKHLKQLEVRTMTNYTNTIYEIENTTLEQVSLQMDVKKNIFSDVLRLWKSPSAIKSLSVNGKIQTDALRNHQSLEVLELNTVEVTKKITVPFLFSFLLHLKSLSIGAPNFIDQLSHLHPWLVPIMLKQLPSKLHTLCLSYDLPKLDHTNFSSISTTITNLSIAIDKKTTHQSSEILLFIQKFPNLVNFSLRCKIRFDIPLQTLLQTAFSLGFNSFSIQQIY
ncbi:hypothetical protein CYY_000492 [Polysphondylium violaceum]|uniref:Uncharacterized protein n=1 Tax=Polysphondylium violaceum TaxID=133409 RepID=A0A8J4Q3Q3_9MYCE|nr:hypothetical protein CYY_000492 [Polysphondylium violaceum]